MRTHGCRRSSLVPGVRTDGHNMPTRCVLTLRLAARRCGPSALQNERWSRRTGYYIFYYGRQLSCPLRKKPGE